MEPKHRLELKENSDSLAKAAGIYGLPRLELVKKVESGVLSHNFIVSDGENKFFLKEHRLKENKHEDKARIQAVQEVERFFVGGGIPVVLPIKDLRGETIFEDNGHFYSLFPFVEGKTYSRENVTESALKSAGSLLARIHRLSKDGLPAIELEQELKTDKSKFQEESEKIRRGLAEKEDLDNFDKQVLKAIDEKEKILAESRIDEKCLDLGKEHLIHGDYKLGNMFFDEEDNVKHLFDTEKVAICPRTFELARSLDLICFNGGFEKKNFINAEAFVGAYGRVYPVRANELADAFRLLYMRKVRSLWVPKEYYNGNTRVAKILKAEIFAIQYWAKHLDEFIEKLTSIMRR